MDNGIAGYGGGGLIIGIYQRGGREAQAENQGCEDDAGLGGQFEDSVSLVELSSSWHGCRVRR
jgi:hypothetical protein